MTDSPVLDPQLRAVVEQVAERPGLSPSALATALGGRRSVALERIRAAVAAGVIGEADTRVPTRGGSQRVTRGLFPAGSSSTSKPQRVAAVASGEELRTKRAQLNLPARVLARHLQVSTGLVYHWETERQPLPTWLDADRLLLALSAANTEHLGGLLRTRRLHEQQRRSILEALAQRPGVTLRELAQHMGRSRNTLSPRLAELVERGEVHQGRVPDHDQRGQGFRGLGYYPGPAPRPRGPVPTVAELTSAAARAGWSQRQVARALGMPASSWLEVSNGHAALPAYVSAVDLAQAYAQVQESRDDLAARVLAYLLAQDALGEPVTRERLTRGAFGRSAAVEVALRDLLDADRVHYAPKLVAQEHRGQQVQRFLDVLRPGPAPTRRARPGLSGAELERLRTARHVSRATLADALEVSRVQIGHWESGRQRIPAPRAAQLRDFLGSIPVQAAPSPGARRLPRLHTTDAELQAAALASIREQPGRSQRQVCAGLAGGSMQRRIAAVQALEAAGQVHRRPDGLHPDPPPEIDL